MNLHLAIPDLLWPERSARTAVDSFRLAALEQLYARGRRSPSDATSLEAWLASAWSAAGGVAAYALLGDGGDPGDAYWLRADPCHLRVERDALMPVHAPFDDLGADEATALATSLDAHFADRKMAFLAPTPARWYLRTEQPLDAPSHPLGGGEPLRTAPRLAQWHALANEIQMVLHAHPVNEARERRGAVPVNALWLWGGGRFVAPARKPYARVRADDPLAAGLARASGAAAPPLPETAAQWLRASPSDGRELMVLAGLRAAAAVGDAGAWRERLAALERDWFAPLLDALRRERLGMVTLHAIGRDGTIAAETTRQDLRYFWRRSKPLARYASP